VLSRTSQTQVGGCGRHSDGKELRAPADSSISALRHVPAAQQPEFKISTRLTLPALIALPPVTHLGDWTKFFNRVRGYTSIWCCIAAHPGHIHYDPWWDIPHTDKFNRQWDTWVPKTGP
jgi:hypothetical protein